MSRRPSPFDELERMFEQFADQFAEQFGMAQQPWERSMREFAEGFGGGFGDAVGIDLVDEGDAFVVAADLPGFDREEIQLSVVDDALHLDAERQRDVEAEEGAFVRRERQQNLVRRRVELPAPVVAEEATADLQNGVLTVTLPKADPEDAGGRQIEIG